MARPLILVVDDHEGVRDALRLVLEPEYEVHEAECGTSALNFVAKRLPSVTLLDLLLPDIDGLAVLKELNARAPDMPVIVLTAVRTVRAAVAAMKLGARDYLSKPFDEDELRSIVRGCLEEGSRAAAREVRETASQRLHRVIVLSRDEGCRATLDVALRSVVTVETTQDWTDANHSRRYAVPPYAVIDTEAPPESIPTDVPHSQTLILRRRDGAWPREGHADSLAPMFIEEVINALRRVASVKEMPSISAEVGRCLEYLAARYGDDVSIEALAEVARVPVRRFPHVFRAETGLSAKDFALKVRIEIARVLLATTEEKVATIAHEVGCFDASHLSRLFLEQTGRRPSFYRRKRR